MVADAQDIQVKELQDDAAPAERKPCCTRSKVTRPPDWRYKEALNYAIRREQGGTATVPVDKIVVYVSRALYALRDRDKAECMRTLWPVLTEVLFLGTTAKHSSITAEMEACLIKGWSHDKAYEAGCPVCKQVYDLYAKVFFDLSGIVGNSSWINDYLIEPERHSMIKTNMRSRLLAYVCKGVDGMDAAITGFMSNSTREALSKLAQAEREKSVMDYMLGRSDMPKELVAGFMETAVKDMSAQRFQEHMKDREDLGATSLEDLAEGIERGVRAYSQHELETENGSGLDFVNQYTKTIAGQ